MIGVVIKKQVIRDPKSINTNLLQLKLEKKLIDNSQNHLQSQTEGWEVQI